MKKPKRHSTKDDYRRKSATDAGGRPAMPSSSTETSNTQDSRPKPKGDPTVEEPDHQRAPEAGQSMPSFSAPGLGGKKTVSGTDAASNDSPAEKSQKTEDEMPAFSMGSKAPKAGTSSADSTKGQPQRVIVEMRVPRARGEAAVSTSALQLTASLASAVGFELDTSYPPVPVQPTERHLVTLQSTSDEVMLVRGTIMENRRGELAQHPNVLAVWTDTRIAPFASGAAASESLLKPAPLPSAKKDFIIAPMARTAPCPIGTCDCSPSVAKGTLADVAHYLGVDRIWATGHRGTGIVIGIVDGGITAVGRPVRPGEANTPRVGRVIGGYPVADWGTTATAWANHGNMTASDALGMAPDAQLYDIRISDGDAVSDALAGFQWAITQHRANGTPQVLSNSWGIFGEDWDPAYARDPNHPFTRKVVEAVNEGILVLFAAGNCGATCPDIRCAPDIGPGRSIWGANGHPLVMTIGAVNLNEQLAGYSSQGPAALDPQKPDFCSITHFKGYFESDSGTSAATPVCAGVVALLKQTNRSLTQAQIKQVLKQTAKDMGPPGWDPHSGFGIIRPKAAYDRITQTSRGRLEIFARGLDNAVWHIWQTAPNSGWSAWQSLRGQVDLLAVGRNADGRLEIFARGFDRALWHCWQLTPGGAWSNWASLGSQIDLLAVGQNADGRLEVFARGMDRALWHIWQTTPNGGWSSWASLGGIIDRLAVGQNSDGRLEAFARAIDRTLCHIWQTAPNNGWSGWASLQGQVELLEVTNNADGRLEVFVVGLDRALWHIWQTAPNNGWSGWASLGSQMDRLAVSQNADGRIEVFTRGLDKTLWHIWQTAPNNGWSGWGSLQGQIDLLEAGQNADGRIEVFARGLDRGLWHVWQTAPNNGWSRWASLAGQIDLLTVGQNIP